MVAQFKNAPSSALETETSRPQTASELISAHLNAAQRSFQNDRDERPLMHLWAQHGFTFDYKSVRDVAIEPILARDIFDRPRVLNNLGDYIEISRNGALKDDQAIENLRTDPEWGDLKLKESLGHTTLKEILVGLFKKNQLRGEPSSLLEAMTEKINVEVLRRMETRHSRIPVLASLIDYVTRNSVDAEVTAEFSAEMKRGFIKLEEMGAITFCLEEIGRKSLAHGKPGSAERTRSEWEEDLAAPILGIRYRLTEPGYQLLTRALKE